VGDKFARIEMMVGADAPVGDLVYVRFAGNDNVVSAPSSITNLLPGKAEDIRSRFVMPGDPLKVGRIEIHKRGGFVQLAKSGDEWHMQQPFIARADPAIIANMIASLFALRVDSFVWDPVASAVAGGNMANAAANQGKDDEYDLRPDIASARIIVWFEGDEVGSELILGKSASGEAKQVYAKRKGIDSVYAVSKVILDTFSMPAEAMRDRLLFPFRPEKIKYVCFENASRKLSLSKNDATGWMIMEPLRWQADDEIVGNLVSALTRLKVDVSTGVYSSTNLIEIGLDPPAMYLTVSTNSSDAVMQAKKDIGMDREKDISPSAKTAAAPESDRLLIGAIAREGKICVKFEKSGFVAEIPIKDCHFIRTDRIDPMIYRDRTVVAIHSKSVRKITLTKDGTGQVVEMGSNGLWRAAGPASGKPANEVLTDLLLNMANLRAVRIESFEPENISAYGVDGSRITLSVGLSGDEGIQKNIFIGFKSGTDGVYARVQGQDLLFVLDKNLAESLSRDIVERSGVPDAP
jgi:hypothetical protein